jgi:HEAT repeat protein
MTTTRLAAALADADIFVRMETIAALVRDPDGSRPVLVNIIGDPTTTVVARLWAMIAICHIGDDKDEHAARAVLGCLSANEAIVRRSAIETLGALKASSAVAPIAHHLTDEQLIPEAWFDDTSSPAQAARRALRSIGTPAALQALGKATRP